MRQEIAITEVGGDESTLDEAWRKAAPALGRLLAEAALRAVEEGELAMVEVGGRRLIVTLEEAARCAGVATLPVDEADGAITPAALSPVSTEVDGAEDGTQVHDWGGSVPRRRAPAWTSAGITRG